MKIFVEYFIKTESREVYLAAIRTLVKESSDLEILEGTDQPGLFVEMWDNCDREQYVEMKSRRENNASPWNEINNCIKGGADKLNIWHFKKIDTKT